VSISCLYKAGQVLREQCLHLEQSIFIPCIVAVRHGMQDREGEAGEGMIRNGGRRREWEWRLGE